VAPQGLMTMGKAGLRELQCPAVEAGTHGESLSTRGCALGSLNTPALNRRGDRSPVALNEHDSGASPRRRARA
jgi:hypothetical protein